MLSAMLADCCVARPTRAVRMTAAQASAKLKFAESASGDKGATEGSDATPAAARQQARPEADNAVSSSLEPNGAHSNGERSEVCGKRPPFRMRFFTFNMANSSKFGDFRDIYGGGSHKQFSDIFTDPFADGEHPDVVFCSLPETRLLIDECLDGIGVMEEGAAGIDQFLFQDAHAEAVLKSSTFRGVVEGLAATYNGNLAAVTGFCGNRFYEEENGSVFGRLAETTLGGAAFPNPKKAFIGRCVCERMGPRFCFVGAHFPLREIKTAVAGQTSIEEAKRAIARSLRKILRRALARGLVDSNTVIFLMGDLNSRTLLNGTEVVDLLMELLRDDGVQAAIQEGLPIPAGQWHEVPTYASAGDLPVTYKFSEEIGSRYMQPEEPTEKPSEADASAEQETEPPPRQSEEPPVTLQAIMDAAVAAGFTGSTEEEGNQREAQVEDNHNAIGNEPQKDQYLEALRAIGQEHMISWGLPFSETDWRPFRFPAAADRLLYWAPSNMGARMHWSLSGSGYQVCHHQGYSDHRPVYVEATLSIDEESKETRAHAAAWMRRSVESLAHCPELRRFLQKDEDSDNAGETANDAP